MPFKIVQTSENNKIRLFTVPSAWEDQNILKWPRKMLTKYIKDEFSTPEGDWKQLRCTVKRQDIPSYETAEYVLKEMLNHTDTEDDTLSSNYKVSGKPVQELNLNIIADEIVYPAKITAEAGPSEIITETCTIPAAPSVGLNNDDVYQFHIVSDSQNNINQHQCCVNLEQNLTIQNVLLSNQTSILEQLNTISKVQNAIIQKLANFSVQLEDTVLQMNQILDRDFQITQLSETKSTASNSAFYVKPIDNIQKLNELEQQLSESSVRQQLKNRYSVICSGGKGIDCAYTLVDILFSRDLLCQFTWSGGSRKDDIKIAFKTYKNILSFFWDMVHSWDVTYTINENESFFKNILKNSKKRKLAKNQRASTSRKRAKLSKLPIANYEDEDTSNDAEKEDNKNSITEGTEDHNIKEKIIDVKNPNVSSENKESDIGEENEDSGKETENDQVIDERCEINLKRSFYRTQSTTEEERTAKELEREQNNLEEVPTDSKEETEENKENVVGVSKNTYKSNEPSISSNSTFNNGSSKPKTKIAKMPLKKREDKRLIKLKKIRRVHKNVSH
ncbi:uncharacterized protein LOC121740592 [Aricia agestis]|uniref:uncharacterized protein LOC121740592 n=1 Tax=Aricia agestis TaxID=91739 RepID=UPI001C201D22|nr:uncharacterized protein LOC121740592 [Aricia agestis]